MFSVRDIQMEKVDGRKQRDVKKSGFSSVLKEGMNLKQARTNISTIHFSQTPYPHQAGFPHPTLNLDPGQFL